MMIVGVMFSCYAMIKFGVKKLRTVYLNNPYTGLKIGAWWEISIRFLAPALGLIMLVWWCWQSIGGGEEWWNPFGIANLGTFIFQGGLMAIIAYVFNNKVADSVKHTYKTDDGTFPEVPDNGLSQN